MKQDKLAFFAIIGAAFFWGTAPVVTKALYGSFEPMPLAFFRFLVASIFIFPFFIKKRTEPFRNLFKYVFPVTIFSFLNIFFFYFGLELSTAESGTIIYTDLPLLVAILSFIFLREKLEKRKILGILLGLSGVFLIILLPIISSGITGDFFGSLLIFFATLSWALYTIGSGLLIKKREITVLSITAVSFFTGLFFSLIAALSWSGPHFYTPILNLTNLFWVIYLSTFGLVLTVLLYQWAIKYASATTASLNQYLQPVFTISLATVFLGEKMTIEFVIGTLFVFAGVFIATTKVELNNLASFRNIFRRF